MPPLKSPSGVPNRFRVSLLVMDVAMEFIAIIGMVNVQIAIASSWIDSTVVMVDVLWSMAGRGR